MVRVGPQRRGGVRGNKGYKEEYSPRKENHKQIHTKEGMIRNYCQNQAQQFSRTKC